MFLHNFELHYSQTKNLFVLMSSPSLLFLAKRFLIATRFLHKLSSFWFFGRECMTLLFFESYHVFHSCLPVPDLVQLTHKLGKISRLGRVWANLFWCMGTTRGSQDQCEIIEVIWNHWNHWNYSWNHSNYWRSACPSAQQELA